MNKDKNSKTAVKNFLKILGAIVALGGLTIGIIDEFNTGLPMVFSGLMLVFLGTQVYRKSCE